MCIRDRFIGSTTGMHIYKTDNPAAPQHMSTFTHARQCDPVIADDDYAYITLRSGTFCTGASNQLDVVDVSRLDAPKLIRTYPMSNPHGLGKEGDLLFICDGKAGLKVYDAARPGNITLRHTIAMSETYDVICYNKIAIVSAKDGLYQYSYADANNIRLLSKISLK